MYNLTKRQKELLRWLVQAVRSGTLEEEFYIVWTANSGGLLRSGAGDDHPEITEGTLDALQAADLVRHGRSGRSMTRAVLLGRAFTAVDTDFGAPDRSFARYLVPEIDMLHLDDELKERCFPPLGAGGEDPKNWDTAIRNAGVVLEQRLRDIGGIPDTQRTGLKLVNDVFGDKGTLASEFAASAERQGHRDLFAGVVGAIRNRYGHHFVDPTPEDGAAIISFTNLLLRMLDDLRQS